MSLADRVLLLWRGLDATEVQRLNRQLRSDDPDRPYLGVLAEEIAHGRAAAGSAIAQVLLHLRQ